MIEVKRKSIKLMNGQGCQKTNRKSLREEKRAKNDCFYVCLYKRFNNHFCGQFLKCILVVDRLTIVSYIISICFHPNDAAMPQTANYRLL
jgi:hypothetical protein